MSYIETLQEGRRRARKQHQCFDCYRMIAVGETYQFQTNKSDYLYTIHQHIDCREASEFYRKELGISPWDFDYDGIPPLADMISDGGEFDRDIAMLRGRFPHVACRLELNDQLAAIRWQMRQIAQSA